jgi:hypothetical protein
MVAIVACHPGHEQKKALRVTPESLKREEREKVTL